MKHLCKLVLSMGIILNSSCDTTELHELNINPNSVNTIDIKYFFTSVELGSASNGSSGDITADWVDNIGICAHAIQQLACTDIAGPGAVGDKYLIDNYTFTELFPLYYLDVAQKSAEVIRQTGPGGFDEGRKVNIRNATRILRVLCFHRLTDWYGSIPYFEANKGLDGILTPKYDKQKDIYADLLNELDEATASLSNSNPDEGFSAADFIFKGDTDKWKKFGYSLMLRLAMRISNVDPVTAGTYVTKAVAGGVFDSNDDNVWVPMAEAPDKSHNGISFALNPEVGFQLSFLSKTLVDRLMGTDQTTTADDDPRLMIISGGIGHWTTDGWTVIPGGDDPLNQRGLPNGMDQAALENAAGGSVSKEDIYSRINFKMLQLNDPYPLMNYAETQFLMAEALERGIGTGITGTAKSHFEAGVKAACQMWTPYDPSLTVSDSAVSAYLAINPYNVAGPALEMIGDQMWISKWMNWWDAWSDWRRTGYPVLTPVDYPGNDSNNQIPTKLIIPQVELASNPNFATGATQPNDFTGNVWWDGGQE